MTEVTLSRKCPECGTEWYDDDVKECPKCSCKRPVQVVLLEDNVPLKDSGEARHKCYEEIPEKMAVVGFFVLIPLIAGCVFSFEVALIISMSCTVATAYLNPHASVSKETIQKF